MESKYPSHVRERISAIASRTGISESDLWREFEGILKDPYIQSDSFPNDDDRYRYASLVLYGRHIGRRPVKPYDVIPVGFSPLRVTSTKRGMASVFALVMEGSHAKLKRIVLMDNAVEKRKDIMLFSLYRVNLGEFSGGDLLADERSMFESPKALPMKPEEVLERMGVKRCTIAEAKNNLSRIGKDGFVDQTDWRIIRGLVTRYYKKQREDGTELGVYTIIDETVEDETKVTPGGVIQRPGLTIWVAPELMLYAEESECDFVGALRLSGSGEVVMNCYLIIPIHPRRVTS
jgi:hypothetical protein